MLLTLSILMASNIATNGSPLRMGYGVYYGKDALPGFGTSGGF